MSIALLDVDHFKKVNDQYGHFIGDAVLKEIARRLTSSLEAEMSAARFGGEEFCMLIPNTSLQQAEQIAERLRIAIDKITTVDDNKLNISISIGVARWPDDGSQLSQVYKAADERLYKAKELGRNKVVSH